ncbi:MAG: NUDIX domain-containing protein [Frankiaceae bacterium]
MTQPAVPADQVQDRPQAYEVVDSVERFDGAVWTVRSDTVRLPDGETVVRDVVDHPGAVGVVALDEDGRVLLVQQYRHPVQQLLWEPPAGLLDDEAEGERAVEAAARELHEEAGYRASDWRVLADLFNSPGGTSEAVRVYLARGLEQVPDGERHEGRHEEADMPIAWLPLDDAVAKVLAGELHNPIAVAGVLAAAAARARTGGFDALRPADAPWPARDR